MGLRAKQARDRAVFWWIPGGSRVCFAGCGRLFRVCGIMVNDVPLSDPMRCCDHMQAKYSVSSDVHAYFIRDPSSARCHGFRESTVACGHPVHFTLSHSAPRRGEGHGLPRPPPPGPPFVLSLHPRPFTRPTRFFGPCYPGPSLPDPRSFRWHHHHIRRLLHLLPVQRDL